MRWLAVMAGVSALCAQNLDPWVLTMSRAKRLAKAEFEKLPNYVCLETVNRTIKKPGTISFRPFDTLRIEVAYIGGKELLAPPGGKMFQDINLEAFATEGVIGTGSFTALVNNLFVNDAARTTGHGEDTINGRRALWYGWAINPMTDAFRLYTKSADAFVGEAGQYWVDAETLQLLRVEEHATDIPADFPMQDVKTVIEYGKVSVGEAQLLMPLTAETFVTNPDGTVNRNVTEFSNCREYRSESAIRFTDDEPQQQEGVKFGTTVAINSGLKGIIYFLSRDTQMLPDFRKMKPRGTIYTTSLNVPPQDFREGFPGVTKRTEWFAIDYTGRFWIERPGNYNWLLTSDDGAKLYIDDALVIDQDGVHPAEEHAKFVNLTRGIHKIRVS